jgi:hypothetical protein
MTTSTVIASPASEIERLLGLSARGRCACCNGPALPVLEQRGDVMLCNRCARHCESKGGNYTHVIPPRTDRDAAERAWSRDLGFKQLGR